MLSDILIYLQRTTKRDSGPGSVGDTYQAIWRSYLYSIPVPFIFIFLKSNKIALLQVDRALSALECISAIDPVVRQHTSVLTKLGRTIDIANYPVFLVVTFLTLCIPIVQLCRIYSKNWRIMLSPHPAGFLLIFVIASLFYALEIWGANSASLAFRSIYQLYFDDLGIYYILQTGVLFVYAFGLLLVVLTILHSLSAVSRLVNR